MPSTSLNSLLSTADRLQKANSRPGSQPPAQMAADDPLQEVLVHDMAARLPAAIGEQMLASRTYHELSGWLAAGAIYDLLEAEPLWRRLFLAELERSGGRPGQVALALARAYNRQHVPPTRSPQWRRRDRAGLVLQLGVAVALAAIRTALLWAVGGQVLALPPGGEWLGYLLGIPLILGQWTVTPYCAWLLMGGTAWLALEAALGPRLMEAARRFPATLKAEPPPVSWRADAFHWFWSLQALFLAVLLWARNGALLTVGLFQHSGDYSWWLTTAGCVTSVMLLALLVTAHMKSFRTLEA